MNKPRHSVLWFLLSFVIIFGSYLVCYVLGGWYGRGYESIDGILAPVGYIVICSIAYSVAKKQNLFLARGFAWGFAAIVVFVFTLGGCGIFR